MTKSALIKTLLGLTILAMVVLLVPAGLFAQSQTDAVEDSAVTPPDTSVDIPALDNDIPGSGTLDLDSVIVTTPPGHGQTSLFDKNAKIFTYTPTGGFTGSDSFVYKVCDQPADAQITPTCDEAEVDIFVGLEVALTVIPRKLNIKKNGVIPVAVYSSEEVDVANIVPESLTLQGVAPFRWNRAAKKIVLKFRAQDIVPTLGTVSDRAVVVLQLTGEDINGVAIMGEDSVIIINKGKP